MSNLFGRPDIDNEVITTYETLETRNTLNIKSDKANAVLVEKQDGTDVFSIDNSTSTTTIHGDLNVLGATTTISSTAMALTDPYVLFGDGNTGNLVDLGWHGLYNDGTARYCGLFKDADDSDIFKLYRNLTVNPLTNIVDTGDASFTLADLSMGQLSLTSGGNTSNLSVNGASRLTADNGLSAGTTGNGVINAGVIDALLTGSLILKNNGSALLTISNNTGSPYFQAESGKSMLFEAVGTLMPDFTVKSTKMVLNNGTQSVDISCDSSSRFKTSNAINVAGGSGTVHCATLDTLGSSSITFKYLGTEFVRFGSSSGDCLATLQTGKDITWSCGASAIPEFTVKADKFTLSNNTQTADLSVDANSNLVLANGSGLKFTSSTTNSLSYYDHVSYDNATWNSSIFTTPNTVSYLAFDIHRIGNVVFMKLDGFTHTVISPSGSDRIYTNDIISVEYRPSVNQIIPCSVYTTSNTAPSPGFITIITTGRVEIRIQDLSTGEMSAFKHTDTYAGWPAQTISYTIDV